MRPSCAGQALRRGLPDALRLKDEMVRQIVCGGPDGAWPHVAGYTRRCSKAGFTRCIFLASIAAEGGRFLLHVYDSHERAGLYLMDVEDLLPAGRSAPSQQAHPLLAQSVGGGGLKLLTVAKGFDTDFADLHPKRLRRLHLGPMYSSAFTLQTGPIREVLDEARSPAGEDWALAWTVEELESERVEVEKGWFSDTEREVFRLDPLAGVGAETGATRITRALILPQRPFQVLAEKDPAGFRAVRKFVVGKEGRVLVYG